MSNAALTQALEAIKSLGDRLGKIDEVIAHLSKANSGAGVNPAALFAGAAKADGTGQAPAFFTLPDGSVVPVKRRSKAIGMGEFLQDLVKVSKNPESDASVAKMEKHGSKLVVKTALAESAGSTGGYTVPPQFTSQIMALAAEEAVLRPRATVLPMESRSLQIPSLDHTGTTAGQSAYFGGVVATWTEEAVTRTESEPAFKMIDLTCHELSFFSVASNTLMADSATTLDAFLTTLFSKAIAWHEDYAFLRGDGVGKPLGTLNAPCGISVGRNSGGAFKLVDAATMLGRFILSGMENGVWVMHQTAIPQLVQLADTAGNAVFIPNFGGAAPGMGGAAMKMPMFLLGLPILFSDKVPPLGTRGDVQLMDPSRYLIGDRMELQIDVSTHANFKSNQTVWRVILRVDGQPWLTAPVTLPDGTTTVSPFIALN